MVDGIDRVVGQVRIFSGPDGVTIRNPARWNMIAVVFLVALVALTLFNLFTRELDWFNASILALTFYMAARFGFEQARGYEELVIGGQGVTLVRGTPPFSRRRVLNGPISDIVEAPREGLSKAPALRFKVGGKPVEFGAQLAPDEVAAVVAALREAAGP